MPWPGPHEMFLIQTREEFLTIEMQSSPEMGHKQYIFLLTHYAIIKFILEHLYKTVMKAIIVLSI